MEEMQVFRFERFDALPPIGTAGALFEQCFFEGADVALGERALFVKCAFVKGSVHLDEDAEVKLDDCAIEQATLTGTAWAKAGVPEGVPVHRADLQGWAGRVRLYNVELTAA